jgi:uncharacterized membrane protein HdeD (DUF308 family)
MAVTNEQILWRWGLIGGIISVVLGFVIIAWPDQTLLVISIIFGIQLIFWGLMLIISRTLLHDGVGSLLLGIIGGVLAIMAGIATFRVPGRTVVILAIILGAAWLVAGLFETIEAIANRDMEHRGWVMIVGAITALAGIVLMSSPVESAGALAIIAGVMMVVMGGVRVVGALQHRSALT